MTIQDDRSGTVCRFTHPGIAGKRPTKRDINPKDDPIRIGLMRGVLCTGRCIARRRPRPGSIGLGGLRKAWACHLIVAMR
jgi:hypothetical protein